MYQCMHIMYLLKPGEPGLSPGPLSKKPTFLRWGFWWGRCRTWPKKSLLVILTIMWNVSNFKCLFIAISYLRHVLAGWKKSIRFSKISPLGNCPRGDLPIFFVEPWNRVVHGQAYRGDHEDAFILTQTSFGKAAISKTCRNHQGWRMSPLNPKIRSPWLCFRVGNLFWNTYESK